jgi:hypothetical protein
MTDFHLFFLIVLSAAPALDTFETVFKYVKYDREQ